ncbi:MAG: hypothetical protein ACR2KS_03130, partial [Candidatus Eremiobacter antarcticus]
MRQRRLDRRRSGSPVPRSDCAAGLLGSSLAGRFGASVGRNTENMAIGYQRAWAYRCAGCRRGCGCLVAREGCAGTAAPATAPAAAAFAMNAALAVVHLKLPGLHRFGFLGRLFGFRLSLRLDAMRRNAGLRSLLHFVRPAAPSAAAAPAPMAVTTIAFERLAFAFTLGLSDDDGFRRDQRFCLGSGSFVGPLLLFGKRCDADWRTRLRKRRRFLGQFAQLLGLLGCGERDLAAATAATAFLLFTGDGNREFGKCGVVSDVEEFDARRLSSHIGAVLDFNDASVDHGGGRGRIRQTSREQLDFMFVPDAKRDRGLDLRSAAQADFFGMEHRVDAHMNGHAEIVAQLLALFFVPKLELSGDRRRRLDERLRVISALLVS